MSRKQFGLSLLIFASMIGGGLLAKQTNSFWTGFVLFLAVFFPVIVFARRPWIDKVSLSMARAIKKGVFSEAIQIGEEELEKETATTGVRINLIAAYYNNSDFDKARSIMDSIDVDKLSWMEKRVYDDWKNQINAA